MTENNTFYVGKYDTCLHKTIALINFKDWKEDKKPNFLWFFHRKVEVDIYLDYVVDENRFYIVKCENGKEVKRTLTKTNIENSLAILLGIKNRLRETQIDGTTIITQKIDSDRFEIIRDIHDNRDKKIEEQELTAFLL